jgi:NitT/TauT family transport system permease protein
VPDAVATLGRWSTLVALKAYPLVAVLLAWQLLAHSGLVTPRLFPDLLQIGSAFVAMVASGDWFYHSRFTLERTLLAFALAAPAGVLLGAWLARSRIAEALLEPVFSFGYPIPKIALFPVFVFIFGLGSASKVAVACLEALYPITLSTYYGIRSTDTVLLWAAQSMGSSPARIFLRVLLPAALPYILSSFRMGMHVALIVVITLELIGDNTGLGFFVTYSANSYKYATFFAGVAAIVIWGFLLDRAMVALNRLAFWQPRHAAAS